MTPVMALLSRFLSLSRSHPDVFPSRFRDYQGEDRDASQSAPDIPAAPSVSASGTATSAGEQRSQIGSNRRQELVNSILETLTGPNSSETGTQELARGSSFRSTGDQDYESHSRVLQRRGSFPFRGSSEEANGSSDGSDTSSSSPSLQDSSEEREPLSSFFPSASGDNGGEDDEDTEDLPQLLDLESDLPSAHGSMDSRVQPPPSSEAVSSTDEASGLGRSPPLVRGLSSPQQPALSPEEARKVKKDIASSARQLAPL